MTSFIWQAIASPLRVFDREESSRKLASSVGIVCLAALLGSAGLSLAESLLWQSSPASVPNPAGMLLVFGASLFSYLIVCLLFFALSSVFRNGLRFRQILSVWGLSYIPNVLCILLYAGLQLLPGARVTNDILAFVIGAAFIFLLVWKAIFFYLFLRQTMNASLRELALTVLTSAAVFAVLLFAGFAVGVQVPML